MHPSHFFLNSVLIYCKLTLCTLCTVLHSDFQSDSASTRQPLSVSPGLDQRDAAFMQRLHNLAHEVLTWPHLGERQRLVWAAALELDAVSIQELLMVSCTQLYRMACSRANCASTSGVHALSSQLQPGGLVGAASVVLGAPEQHTSIARPRAFRPITRCWLHKHSLHSKSLC